MLGLLWDGKVDMWSFGCLLAELVLASPIFHASTVEAVLASHVAVCGPMPSHMVKRSPETARMYFTSSGGVYQVDPPSMGRGVYTLQPKPHAPLRTLIGSIIDDRQFLSFLSSILTLDPQKRPSAREALQHPWLVQSRAEAEARHAESPSQRVERLHSFTAGVLADYDSCPSDSGYMSSDASPGGRNGGGSSRFSRSDGFSHGSDSEGSVSSRSTSPSPRSQANKDSLRMAASLNSARRNSKDSTELAKGIPRPPSTPKGSDNGKGRAGGALPPGVQATKGPGVPKEFRNTMEGESGAMSGGHDWRSRFVRFLAPPGQHGSPNAVHPAIDNKRSSGDDSPSDQGFDSSTSSNPASRDASFNKNKEGSFGKAKKAGSFNTGSPTPIEEHSVLTASGLGPGRVASSSASFPGAQPHSARAQTASEVKRQEPGAAIAARRNSLNDLGTLPVPPRPDTSPSASRNKNTGSPSSESEALMVPIAPTRPKKRL